MSISCVDWMMGIVGIWNYFRQWLGLIRYQILFKVSIRIIYTYIILHIIFKILIIISKLNS
jgi:hypothetical protein